MKSVSSQKGLSLIALLIGLLISVLCILASLTLYKTLIRVATESTVDSRHDGQIATASLIIQMEVQSAGYGIANADADDVLADSGQQRLMWRYSRDQGATFECRGLLESALVEGTETFRVLSVIKVASGCNGTAALPSFNWIPTSVLGRWRFYDDGVDDAGLDKYIATNTSLFKFQVVESPSCSPFGAPSGTAQKHLRLRVEVPGSAYLQGAVGVAKNTYDFCLANTYPT